MYYLLDTSHVPKNDRIVTSYVEGAAQFVTINCACINENMEAQFLIYHRKKKELSANAYKRLKLITLATLIKIIATEVNSFNVKHIFYVVEPNKTAYTFSQAKFLESGTSLVQDWIITNK